MSGQDRAPLGLDDDEEDLDLSQFAPKQRPATPPGASQATSRATSQGASQGASQNTSQNAPQNAPPAKAALREMAKEQGFVSRQAGIRRRRRRRSGRNEQINIKTTPEYADRFYAIAETHDWMCAVVFEKAIAALEQDLEARKEAGEPEPPDA
jgi:hypothetical protein